MNKLSSCFIIMILMALYTSCCMALPGAELQQDRMNTIKQYVRLLGRGDGLAIPKLFTKHAVAVSSAGESDSIDHFYSTLFSKSLLKPQSRLINVFDGQLKDNMMTAYYNLSWINAQGLPESAKFLDLFIFQADSSKIKTIYVFSNRFQESALNFQEEKAA